MATKNAPWNDVLAAIAKDLAESRPSPRWTVRRLLKLFDHHRRGFNVVEQVRKSLEAHKLATYPDFEAPHIDTELMFVSLRDNKKDDAVASVAVDGSEVITARRLLSDPIWRIQRLRSSNVKLVSVTPNDDLSVAITRMLHNDFSQLPVLSGERELKGVISWASIGSRLAFGRSPKAKVKEFLADARVVRHDTPLLTVIPEIIEYQFVFVRGSDQKITGIVTTTDLAEEFKEQAQSFLILREIEHQIRQFLMDIAGTTDEELQRFAHPHGGKAPKSVHDLSFGDYIAIIQNKDWWSKVTLPIDRDELLINLDTVRQIRNDVMHFDPDTFSNEAVDPIGQLRNMNSFFQRMLSVVAPSSNRVT